MKSKIQIYETDYTQRVNAFDATANIAFIPGFTDATVEYNTLYKCETVSEFERLFGKDPVKFSDEGDVYDTSYIYAKELLNKGLIIYYLPVDRGEYTAKPDCLTQLYAAIPNALDKLTDKNNYDVKFLTCGGYPVYRSIGLELTQAYLKCACSRNDCVALIDYEDSIVTDNNVISLWKNVNTNLLGSKTDINDAALIAYKVQTGLDHYEDSRNYGTMFTSSYTQKLFAKYTTKTLLDYILPGSFAYLSCFIESVNNKNPNFYAIAGVTRGAIKGFEKPTLFINGTQADEIVVDKQEEYGEEGNKVLGGIAINPITNIDPYGYCIWGNRTLHANPAAQTNEKDTLSASSFLHLRLLSCDVKKILRHAALKLNFEIYNEILWLNFKAAVSPQLDTIISKYGIDGYELIQVKTDDKAKVSAIVRLYCQYAVEGWDIEVQLTDSYTTVE